MSTRLPSSPFGPTWSREVNAAVETSESLIAARNIGRLGMGLKGLWETSPAKHDMGPNGGSGKRSAEVCRYREADILRAGSPASSTLPLAMMAWRGRAHRHRQLILAAIDGTPHTLITGLFSIRYLLDGTQHRDATPQLGRGTFAHSFPY